MASIKSLASIDQGMCEEDRGLPNGVARGGVGIFCVNRKLEGTTRCWIEFWIDEHARCALSVMLSRYVEYCVFSCTSAEVSKA